jgi:acetoin:2,6-dichlorophenolindophenol oxidoreductase subunit beta
MPGNITLVAALREALIEEMERDERLFYLGQDAAIYGGVFQMTAGLIGRFGPERIIDSPISENFIAGGGVGAAITGMRPIVELSYADFVGVAMDEIYNKAAKWRYMHGGLFAVPLTIVSAEGAVGGAGPEHSQCPEGLFLSAAGMYVVMPSSPADAKGLFKSSLRDDNPVLFMVHKALFNMTGDVPEGEHLVPIGKADIRRAGKDVTVVAWSNMVLNALEAAEQLAKDGISVEVIDPRGVRPLDMDTILKSVERTGRLVTAQEAPKPGGPGREVAGIIAEQALDILAAPIKQVGPPDVPIPQSMFLEKYYVPSTADIVTAVKEVAGA